jgi:hypothetical protein
MLAEVDEIVLCFQEDFGFLVDFWDGNRWPVVNFGLSDV